MSITMIVIDIFDNVCKLTVFHVNVLQVLLFLGQVGHSPLYNARKFERNGKDAVYWPSCCRNPCMSVTIFRRIFVEICWKAGILDERISLGRGEYQQFFALGQVVSVTGCRWQRRLLQQQRWHTQTRSKETIFISSVPIYFLSFSLFEYQAVFLKET